jgi:regulatory protein
MKRKPRPLNAEKLGEIALAYVARYATSSAKLAAYLQRKLHERGWDGESEPDVHGLVGRYLELGYIDDETYARTRSDGLLRRGYGKRRIDVALQAAGIDSGIREAIAPEETTLRQAALAMARKRRFGPFGAESLDRDRREKQIAAMLRAGHGFDDARTLVRAPSEEAAEQWAASGKE